MKYFNHKIIGIAMMCVTVMACTDKYDCNLQVEKPEEVANSEYLASFDLLKSYITRDAGSPFKFTANLSSTDFLKKDIAYSTILSNFDGVDIGGSFTTSNSLKEDGSYDFGGMQLVFDAIKGTDITVYGGTLCSNQEQCTAYYNELIQPIIIPFVPEKGKTVICDFENDELGKVYGMTGGSQAVHLYFAQRDITLACFGPFVTILKLLFYSCPSQQYVHRHSFGSPMDFTRSSRRWNLRVVKFKRLRISSTISW